VPVSRSPSFSRFSWVLTMREVRSQIAIDQTGLGTALKTYQLEVPPNQREYSWTEVEVTQLLQDFAKAVNEGSDYFLGTIVTIPRRSGALEVVDGQQRLATAALLLAAIRDYLKDKNEDVLVESINNDFLTGIDRVKRARVPKLRLNVDDNDLFTSIVAEGAVIEPCRPSHELLVGAYELAQRHVRNIVAIVDAKTHGDFLEKWVSFIEHSALVILLRVPDGADAYKMFETLNDRGLRTSQADLIKNYLFGRSGSRFSEVQTRWAYMRGALESLDEEDITINFLRHALVMTEGYLSAPQVYDAVQGIAKSEQSTVTFATRVESLANTYVATFNPDHERWNDYPSAARSSIEVFNLFNIRPMRALLLAIGTRMKAPAASESLAFLVSLGARLMIASTIRSGSVEAPLSLAARDVFAGKIASVTQLKRQLKGLTPSDQQFREAFDRTRVSSARLGRYFLRSLEMAAKNEAEPWFVPQGDRSIINLEHVLPQKPEGNWNHFTEDDVALYAKRLGNLVLMRASDNSHVKSASFREKKQIYAKSPYVLTSQIGGLEEWTVASIVDRQKRLAELAVTTWPTH
jgi:Protein of unknown function DUF262/Protein of unknown function (DUF1524)